MSLVPVEPGRCPHTEASREPGFIWRCQQAAGHTAGQHYMRREQTKGGKP